MIVKERHYENVQKISDKTGLSKVKISALLTKIQDKITTTNTRRKLYDLTDEEVEYLINFLNSYPEKTHFLRVYPPKQAFEQAGKYIPFKEIKGYCKLTPFQQAKIIKHFNYKVIRNTRFLYIEDKQKAEKLIQKEVI